MAQIVGGCLCGKVRYSTNAEPAFTGVCHCRDCQKFSGSAFATVIAVPKDTLSVQGKLNSFSKPGDTGQSMTRSFCPECGSGVLDEAAVMPGLVMINVGSLDDPSWVKPGMQIYCDSAQPWVELGGGMQSFAKMPG
jgi:hypothetical protein